MRLCVGKIEYDVPDFVKIEIDPVERQATLSVEDTSIKQQREMWGEYRRDPFDLLRKEKRRLTFFFSCVNQERHGRTSTATLWAYPRATQPSSAWWASAIEQPLKTAPT